MDQLQGADVDQAGPAGVAGVAGRGSLATEGRLRVVGYGAHLGWWLVGAGLLALAFPPVGWWPLAYVALVPIGVAVVRSDRPGRLFVAGWVAGLVFWLVMAGWLRIVTVPGYVAVAGIMALFFAAAGPVLWLLHHDRRLPMFLAMPLGWVSLELLRSVTPAGGFSWFFLAHSQAPYLPQQAASRIIQLADLFSEFGVSFLIAMVNGVIIDALTYGFFDARRKGYFRMRWDVRAGMGLTAFALAFAFFYGQQRITETAQVTRPGATIAVVQTNVPQDVKTRPTQQSDLLLWQQLVDLTHEAAALSPRPDVIVWPETTVPGALNREAVEDAARWAQTWSRVDPDALDVFFHYPHLIEEDAAALGMSVAAYVDHQVEFYAQRSEVRMGVSALAELVRVPLLIGSSTYVPRDDRIGRATQRFNSVYFCDAAGQFATQRFDKVHRVPFGEYLPWIETFPALKDWVLTHFTPYDFDYSLTAGRTLTVFEIPFDVAANAAASDDAVDTMNADDMADATEATPTDNAIHTDNATPATIRAVTPICFEDVVGRLCRRMAYDADGSKRADVFINVTNDGWYPGTPQGYQHFQIAVLRCVENRLPMARSVNTGVSGFIDSAGTVLTLVNVAGEHQQVEAVAAWTLPIDDRRTLFARLGHGPAWGMALATAAMILTAMGKRMVKWVRGSKAKPSEVQ